MRSLPLKGGHTDDTGNRAGTRRRPAGRPAGLAAAVPAGLHFLIAYAFTWTYDLLFLVRFPLPDVPGRSTPRDLGPSVAALVVTAAVAGKPGVTRLLRRLVLWRVPAGWYLAILPGVPALFTLGIL